MNIKVNDIEYDLNDYQAVAYAEGFEQPESVEQYIASWQHLVLSGLAWSLQGWFGRTAQSLWNQGIIEPKDSYNKEEGISIDTWYITGRQS